MNLLPIAVLYLVSKLRSNGSAQPSWPGPNHPPPKRARHGRKHPAQPDTNEAIHDTHPAEQHQAANDAGVPIVHTGEAIIHKRATASKRKPSKRKPRGKAFKDLNFADLASADPSQHPADVPAAQPAPAHSNVETHQSGDVVYTVARVQAVLRGLGWTGDNQTKATRKSVSPDLTDGNYGPVTAGNWVRSAHKRGLDPTIDRVDGQHVTVNPDTYAALVKAARALGANVSGTMYIP